MPLHDALPAANGLVNRFAPPTALPPTVAFLSRLRGAGGAAEWDYADFFSLTPPTASKAPGSSAGIAVSTSAATGNSTTDGSVATVPPSPAQVARAMFTRRGADGATPNGTARFIWATLLRFRLLVAATGAATEKEEQRVGETEEEEGIIAGWRVDGKGEDWIRLSSSGSLANGELIVITGNASRWLPSAGEDREVRQELRGRQQQAPSEGDSAKLVGLATLLRYEDGWPRWWMHLWWFWTLSRVHRAVVPGLLRKTAARMARLHGTSKL